MEDNNNDTCNGNDTEYKRIYDINILKKYSDIIKKSNIDCYDDTCIDNINIYELENIVSNNIDNYYNNNKIFHITPIVFSIFFAINSLFVIGYFI